MKKIISVFMIALFLSVFSSCTTSQTEESPLENNAFISEEVPSKPTEGGVLRLSMHNVDTLNPLITKNSLNSEILSLCYDGLFALKSDLYPENLLCESFFLSDDGLTLTLNIKKDVKFHDGSTLTATDVLYSILLAKESGGVYSRNLSCISNAVVLEDSVKMTLSSPEFNFISMLTFPIIKKEMSVNDAILKSGDYKINGTGHFMLKDYELNKTLIFTAFENHSSGKMPYIRDVRVDIVKDKNAVLSMFKSSLTDVLLPDIINDDIALQLNCRELGLAYGSFVFLGINNQNPILLDTGIKRIISDSINRDSLVSLNKTRLKKSTVPIYPQSWLCPDSYENDYMPESAKSAILSLGWSDTDNNGILDKTILDEKTDLFFDILVNDSQEKIRIAEIIKKNLDDIGIRTSITILPFWDYTDRITNKNYDLFIGEVRFSDNQNISDFVSGGGNLFGAYYEEISNTLDKLSRTGEREKIQEIFPSLKASFSEHLPLIGLYFKDDAVFVNKRIKGNLTPVRGNTFANICDWFIY